MRICSINDCDRPHCARGYCTLHYYRWRNHGDPNPVLRRPRGAGSITNGYLVFNRKGKKSIRDHCAVMEEFLGRPLLDHENVHHKNLQRADNRIENLELWTTHQPKGARVEDMVVFAKEILALYDHGA